jgi:hypothetical protein
MVKRIKSVKKGRINRKKTQKGGFLNMLFGNEKGGATESPGIFASVGNFFSSATKKSEELLNEGQNKLKEGYSAASEKLNKSRESIGNVISGKPAEDSTTMAPQTPMANNQMNMANNQMNMADNQMNMADNQMNMAANQPPMANNQMNMDTQMDMEKRNAMAGITSGGRKKKVLKGGRGLGLMYYASPVYDSNVAQPTYWMTGGKRRSHKKRRNSKKTRKTRHKKR